MPPANEPPRPFQYRLRDLLVLQLFFALSAGAWYYFRVNAAPCIISLFIAFVNGIFCRNFDRNKAGTIVLIASLMGGYIGAVIVLNFRNVWTPYRSENIENRIRYLIVISVIVSSLIAAAVTWWTFPDKSNPKV
jgi:hypothetical protein